MRQHAFALVIGSIAGLVGGSSLADPPPKPERDRARELDTMRMHMHANFDLVRGIERLLIRGKLEEAKRFATAIAMAPDEPAHGPWATRVITVRDRAAELARATTVESAVRGVAKLGAACASCHAEATTELAFTNPPPVPSDKPSIEARMLRHRWAADRLWEGIVGNADEAWLEGLAVMSSTPLDLPPDRAALARKLKQLADRARRDKSGPTARATTYGEILGVCASCHTLAAPEASTAPRR
jgi:cytochrome c553